MKPRSLSATSMEMLLQCRHRFFRNYYAEEKPPVTVTPQLRFGRAVHKALEELNRSFFEADNYESARGVEQGLKFFDKAALQENLADPALLKEGREIIRRKANSFNPSERILGIEKTFELETKNGTPFTGVIDKLAEYSPGVIVIVDYKTSRVVRTSNELDMDVQISMYDLAVSKMYPECERIILILDFLRLHPQGVERTPEQRAEFEVFLDSVYEFLTSLSEDDMTPNLNEYCPWCNCKDQCPAYSELLKSGDFRVTPMEHLNEETFIREWVELHNLKRAVEARERELKMWGETHMREMGRDIEVGNRRVTFVQQRSTSFDPEKILASGLIPSKDLPGLVQFQKRSLENYAKGKPQLQELLKDAAIVSYKAPFMKFYDTGNKSALSRVAG